MLEYILFAIGFVFLLKGADLLVDGASLLASKLGVSQLIIGLTIVAFGTSAPELVVAIISSLEGTSQVVLGNVIGSNISNILLILGAAAILYPLKIKYSTIWKEIPFSLLAALLLLALVSNGGGIEHLTFYDGITMLSVFLIFIYYTFSESKQEKKKKQIVKFEKKKLYRTFLMIIAGLIGLLLGGKWVVDGAIFIARNFGLSEFLISATIIAIGTSLPELAVAVSASLKHKADIAIGNVVGSNIFNILLVLGTTSLVAPISVPGFVSTDIVFLVYMTALLFGFVYINKKKQLEKWHGVVFIVLYIAYLFFLIGRG